MFFILVILRNLQLPDYVITMNFKGMVRDNTVTVLRSSTFSFRPVTITGLLHIIIIIERKRAICFITVQLPVLQSLYCYMAGQLVPSVDGHNQSPYMYSTIMCTIRIIYNTCCTHFVVRYLNCNPIQCDASQLQQTIVTPYSVMHHSSNRQL